MKAGVVGAGIMGRLVAFSLINAGWEVILFDREDHHSETNCSAAAAGLLAPVAELDKSDPIIYELGEDAFCYWQNIMDKLADVIYFRRLGSLIVSHPRDQSELGRFIHMIASKIKHKKNYQAVTEEKIKQLEPELSKFSTGYFFPSEGQLDNQSLLKALWIYLHEKKVTWCMNSFIQELKPGQINVNGEIKKFDMVFDCRGLGAKSVFKTLRGIRGELIWLHAPDVNIERPVRLLHPRYSLYVVPRPHHTYILGASEIESEDTSSISVRTTMELLSAAYYLHAGFVEARVIKTVVNHRPTLSDHLPKMKYTNGLIAVNGLYRHGYLIAPTLMDEVERYLKNGIASVRYPQLWEKWHDYDTVQ